MGAGSRAHRRRRRSSRASARRASSRPRVSSRSSVFRPRRSSGVAAPRRTSPSPARRRSPPARRRARRCPRRPRPTPRPREAASERSPAATAARGAPAASRTSAEEAMWGWDVSARVASRVSGARVGPVIRVHERSDDVTQTKRRRSVAPAYLRERGLDVALERAPRPQRLRERARQHAVVLRENAQRRGAGRDVLALVDLLHVCFRSDGTRASRRRVFRLRGSGVATGSRRARARVRGDASRARRRASAIRAARASSACGPRASCGWRMDGCLRRGAVWAFRESKNGRPA